MRSTNLSVWLLAVAVAGSAAPLSAQIDYRNLDDDRPVVTEDAYPVEFRAFEFLMPYTFEREPDGGRLQVLTPEIEYGIIRNGQFGIKLPLALVEGGGDSDWGVAGLRAFGLYNLNTESRWLPAFSARADLLLPLGALGGDGSRVILKGIATRTWGRTRFHGNGAWALGGDARQTVADPGADWSYSLAVDRTLFRQSILVVGEVVTLRPVAGAPVQVTAGIGARYQWTPTTVIDFGVRRRLRANVGPDLALTLGASHTFGLPWLLPRAAVR